MREELRKLCSSFIENRDIIKDTLSWESTYLYPVCAAIFTDKRQKADAEQLKRCKDILKEKTGIFSNFRGNAKLAMLSMMAVDSAPEVKLSRALQVYEELKKHFYGSEYLPVASMVIADMVEPEKRAAGSEALDWLVKLHQEALKRRQDDGTKHRKIRHGVGSGDYKLPLYSV